MDALKRIYLILGSFLQSILGVSCVEFEPRPLSAEVCASACENRSLDDPGLKAFLEKEKAAGSWDVEKLALAATYFHPNVAVARALAGEACAAIKTAEMKPNPVFTFSPQWASNNIHPVTPWFFGVNPSFPAETRNKRSIRTERARLAAEAANLRICAAAWAARTRVRAALLQIFSNRENTGLTEKEIAVHQEIVEKLSGALEAGDVSQFELTQARLSLNRARLLLQDARRNASMAEAELAAAVGVPVCAIQKIRIDLSVFQQLPEPCDTMRKALTCRADLMSLLIDYAAAEEALKLEVSRQYPDLHWRPGYDYNSGQNRWQFGLSFELPLNGNRGPIAEAEARRVTAEKRFLAQQAVIQGQLETAHAAFTGSRAKVRAAEQIAREARGAAAAAKKGIAAGDLSPLEYARRQIEVSAADLAVLAARVEAQAAAGALEEAMQSPLN